MFSLLKIDLRSTTNYQDVFIYTLENMLFFLLKSHLQTNMIFDGSWKPQNPIYPFY